MSRWASVTAVLFLSASYSQQLQQPDADYPEIQKKWLGDLRTFVEANPKSEDAAEAMLRHEASACTDITGFGLLVHALRRRGTTTTALTLRVENAMNTRYQSVYNFLTPRRTVSAGVRASCDGDRIQIDGRALTDESTP